MKIIFLDIDGVLNSNAFLATNPGCMDRGGGWETQLDPFAVAKLSSLLDCTGAKLVLSSTWRKDPIGLGVTQRALMARGLESRFLPFLGATPSLWRTEDGKVLCRGDEIQAWLDASPILVERFVILDDSEDMGHLMDRLVRVDGGVGLTDADVLKAVKLLLENTRDRCWGCGARVGTPHSASGRCGEGVADADVAVLDEEEAA